MSETEWENVFEQIRSDIEAGDFTAIYEILDKLPSEILRGYIGER